MDSVKVTVNRRQSLDNKYSKKPQSEFTWNNCFYLYIVEFLLIIAFFIALYPRDFAKVYPHISTESYRSELVKKTTGNLSYSNPFETPYCSYNELIDENRYVLTEPNISTIYDETNIRIGGEYYPSDCKPKFSTAILVAFRNREEQLKTFLTYIHNFLRQQKIHYRIFVIEQANDKPFNHAKLINIGYQHAKRLNFPCIILHDVDLLPMNLGNLYVCTQQPRHMSANIDKFRYNLPFGDIFGGVVAIRSKHFAAINGLSNKFEGWGGEDDDFFFRVVLKEIYPYRVPPKFNFYRMILHKSEHPNDEGHRYDLLMSARERQQIDGLNSLEYTELDYQLKQFYTHILVET